MFRETLPDQPDQDMEAAVVDACEQVEAKRYETQLREAGITKIVKLALIVKGKRVRVRRVV